VHAYVTTSWDDGGAFDLTLAERLREHGVSGTFYWSVDCDRFPMPSSKDCKEILALDMEVGSHTMTHPDLTATKSEDLIWELEESKIRLEVLTGREVSSFCYPFGYFDRRTSGAVARAGYSLGRTTVGFRKELGADPFQMPVTFQVYPHGRRVHASHAVKERNGIGLGRWLSVYRAGTDLVALTAAAVDEVRTSGGFLHLWGHSWEIEEYGLWGALDQVLGVLEDHADISFVTNGELMALEGNGESV